LGTRWEAREAGSLSVCCYRNSGEIARLSGNCSRLAVAWRLPGHPKRPLYSVDKSVEKLKRDAQKPRDLADDATAE
jgi:hypothetical protein